MLILISNASRIGCLILLIMTSTNNSASVSNRLEIITKQYPIRPICISFVRKVVNKATSLWFFLNFFPTVPTSTPVVLLYQLFFSLESENKAQIQQREECATNDCHMYTQKYFDPLQKKADRYLRFLARTCMSVGSRA